MTNKKVSITLEYIISGLSNNEVAKIIQTISETEETLEDVINSVDDYINFKIIIENECP